MAEKVVRLRAWILGALVVAGVALGARWWLHGRFLEATDNAYVRADTTVITPRVGGEIVKLAVRDNQAVRKGELLMRIDASDFQAKVDNASATIAMREAELAGNQQQQATQRAQIEEARAGVAAANAERDRAEKDLDRARRLVATGVVSTARLDDTTASAVAARAQCLRAQATLRAQEQMLVMMGSNRLQLQAAVDAARATAVVTGIDFTATEIRAPIDGTVGDLAAHLGERVDAGRRLLSLVPLSQVYVEANFKETQVNAMAPGQAVSLTVDAYPGRHLRGHVESFSPASGAEFALLPPDNATGNFNKVVQRLPVRIAIDDAADLLGQLRPGMSVEAEIDTRTSPVPPATTARR